jgi:hypothetical protein
MMAFGRERKVCFWPEVEKSGHLLIELSMASLCSAHPTSCYYRLIAESAATGESTPEHDPVENRRRPPWQLQFLKRSANLTQSAPA